MVPNVSKWGFQGGISIEKWSQNFDSGTRSTIFGTPKTAKMTYFGRFGDTKNGTSGARIKILRPLFNRNTPLKPPFRHFGNHFGPPKSDFWPFYFFGHFPIEIPIKAENFLGRAFQLSQNENKNCFEILMAKEMGLDRAPIEF